MIDRTLLHKLLLLSAALFIVSSGAALIVWKSTTIAAGLMLGFALGVAPFLTWSWILARGLATRRNRILSIILVIVKVGAYSGVLYVCVTRPVANPVAVFIAMTATVFIFTAGTMMGLGARPREAA